MDYNHITNFLEKFKKLLFQKEEVNNIIKEIITKHVPFEIDPSMIKIKGPTIYIQSSPLLKNEIFIHKQGILEDINNLITEARFTDIK